MSAVYTRESLAHALAHHSSRGVLGQVSTTPSRGRPWRVAFPEGSTTVPAVEVSDTEAYAMCVALTAAEHHERANYELIVRELSQRDGPICLDDQLEHDLSSALDLLDEVAEWVGAFEDPQMPETTAQRIAGLLARLRPLDAS